MLKEFKAFVMRGNVLDLAVGIIIGAAFGSIVKSLVDDVIMPPIGLALGNVDFADLFVLLKEGPKAAAPYASLADAQAVWRHVGLLAELDTRQELGGAAGGTGARPAGERERHGHVFRGREAANQMQPLEHEPDLFESQPGSRVLAEATHILVHDPH